VFWRRLNNLPAGLVHRYRVGRRNWREMHVPRIISPWHVNILPAPNYRLLYHSVPKAACSLLRALMLELSGINTCDLNTETLTRMAQERFLRPFAGRSPRYTHYARFCVVRNPWSRLVSCYKSLKRNLQVSKLFFMPYEYREIDFQNMDFTEFARFVSAKSERQSNHHFRSQHYFLAGCKMDFVGRFENLQTDLHMLISRYQLPDSLEDFSERYFNRSEDRTDYREYYDDKTRRLIAERYAKDIRLFNYSYHDA
jgi:hypothetical protein